MGGRDGVGSYPEVDGSNVGGLRDRLERDRRRRRPARRTDRPCCRGGGRQVALGVGLGVRGGIRALQGRASLPSGAADTRRRGDRGRPSSVGVVRGEASGQAVAPYSQPVARLGCLIALTAVLAAGLAAAARADADPASDMLYTGDVFLPYEQVSPEVAADLRGAVRDARADGKPLKVAVIATKRDLGGVPTLFGNPLYYARFLGAELQFLYSGRLLVVMPQGAALSQRGKLVANPRSEE